MATFNVGTTPTEDGGDCLIEAQAGLSGSGNA
jgi:hypothetical protein